MTPETYTFRLFVAGDAPNSRQAIANLIDLCETYLPDQHEIEIVDVVRDPGSALKEKIFMTPTLVTVLPHPGHRIVGTLSNTQPILQILGLGVARREFVGLKDRNQAPQLRRES